MSHRQRAEVLGPIDISDEKPDPRGGSGGRCLRKIGKRQPPADGARLGRGSPEYPSNQEFGRWYDQSPYPAAVTNHSMRAALIRIGEREDIAAEIIENSDSSIP